MTSALSKGQTNVNQQQLVKLDFCLPDCRPGVIWFKSLQCHGHHYWWSGCNVWMEIVSASIGHQTCIEHYRQPAARPARKTYETGLTWKLAMQYATCSQGCPLQAPGCHRWLTFALGDWRNLLTFSIQALLLGTRDFIVRGLWTPGNFSWSAHTRSPLVRRWSRDEPLRLYAEMAAAGTTYTNLHKVVIFSFLCCSWDGL